MSSAATASKTARRSAATPLKSAASAVVTAQRRYPDGHAGRAEDWDQWWQSVAADPALAEAAAERARGHVHHGSEGARLGVHTDALSAAGFAEVGTLWQRGSSRVLCGVR